MGTAGAMSTKKPRSLNDPRLKKDREVYGKYFNKVYKAVPILAVLLLNQTLRQN
jgi:hypothetical protein